MFSSNVKYGLKFGDAAFIQLFMRAVRDNFLQFSGLPNGDAEKRNAWQTI
jgi:hypothetical protein